MRPASCNHHERMGIIPMRDRNAGISRYGDGARYPGNDLEGNSGFGQRLRLFTTASKYEGIAAFQAADVFSLARLFDHEPLDVFLLDVLDIADIVVGFLSNIDDFSVRARLLEQV